MSNLGARVASKMAEDAWRYVPLGQPEQVMLEQLRYELALAKVIYGDLLNEYLAYKDNAERVTTEYDIAVEQARREAEDWRDIAEERGEEAAKLARNVESKIYRYNFWRSIAQAREEQREELKFELAAQEVAAVSAERQAEELRAENEKLRCALERVESHAAFAIALGVDRVSASGVRDLAGAAL